MSSSPPPRKLLRTRPKRERRAPAGAPGSLRWLQGLLGRPVGLERRDGQWHVVLVERRRRPGGSHAVEALRDELRVRLLACAGDDPMRAMPALAQVHHALGHGGWRAVEAMAADRLAIAQAEAERLLREAPSDAFGQVVDRLRVLRVGAQLREQRLRVGAAAARDSVQVSDSTPEEFESAERLWADTVSPPET